jgi:hypothetical protein
MTVKKEEMLRALYEEIAESVAEAPDADIVEECRTEGESVEQVADHMRDVLRSAWKGFQQRSLREAREKYVLTAAALRTMTIQLPMTAAERRQMFTGVLSRPSVDTSKPATDGHLKTGHHWRGDRDSRIIDRSRSLFATLFYSLQ